MGAARHESHHRDGAGDLPRSTAAILGVVLGIVLISGSVAAMRFASADPSARFVYNLDIDTSTYDSLARQLSSSWSLRMLPTTQPPGFVVLLATIYTVFGPSHLAAKLVFCSLLAVTALIAALVMWRRPGLWKARSLRARPFCLRSWLRMLRHSSNEVPAACLVTVIIAMLVTGEPHWRLWRDAGWCAGLATLCAVAALVREVLVGTFSDRSHRRSVAGTSRAIFFASSTGGVKRCDDHGVLHRRWELGIAAVQANRPRRGHL